jgi:hypothetical protein
VLLAFLYTREQTATRIFIPMWNIANEYACFTTTVMKEHTNMHTVYRKAVPELVSLPGEKKRIRPPRNRGCVILHNITFNIKVTSYLSQSPLQ